MSEPLDPYKPPMAALDAPPADLGPPVPPSIVVILGKTRPWVKLLGVVFFVLFGIMIAFGIAAAMATRSLFPVSALIPFMIVIAVYMPPALFLWQYAGNIQRLQSGGGLPALEAALTSQKSLWKYLAILAIVMAVIYAATFASLTFLRGAPRQ
jgi:hypothetical protein